MKATIVIGVLLCLSVIVLSRKPEPALQPYPLVFTAIYNESDAAVYWQAPRMNTAYLDAPNKRASISYTSEKGKAESWTLIYRPKGGDPISPASQGYTGFNINPDFPNNVPNNCYYTTGPLISIAPFPSHWNRYGDSYSVAIDAWFNLPNDLIYAGQYFIPELGVMSDRWDTISQCVLKKSGIGKVPCTSVMYSQGEDPVPLMDIRAYGASKNSSETDSYAVRVYHSFITSVDDSNFALPNNWEVNCGNADYDFVTEPDTDLLVCDGDENAITIQLAAPPVPGLGDVKVYLTPDPTSYYTCVECLDFEEDYLIFTSDNWDEPQQFPIDYSCTGCSQYLISAYGGGYDWTYSERTIVVYTNKKEKLGNCVARPICSYHYNCGHHIGESLNTNM